MEPVGETVHFPFRIDKNYMPVSNRPGRFVTDMTYGLVRMASISLPTRKEFIMCTGCEPWRGSTPLVRHGDGYVCLVHNKYPRGRYENAFAYFDGEFRRCCIGRSFTAFADISPVNFTCGMEIEGDDAILPICVCDRETHLFRLPLKDFLPPLVLTAKIGSDD